MNISDLFVELVYNLSQTSPPAQSVKKIRTCLVDMIGVAIAGAHDLQDKELRFLDCVFDAEAVVAPIGMGRKCSLANAIFLNGLSSHYLELDDGVRFGVIHPSAPLLSALLPIAQINTVSWRQFCQGAVCGYEASIRLAHALQPHHYNAGFHPTATCCTIGTAVGIAVMLGFGKDKLKDAFSAATVSSYGTLKVLEDVSQLKPYNCGKAAMMGFYSAMMAAAGFCGPSDPMGGDVGFLKMMAFDYDESVLLRQNDYLYVDKVYLKPYASCRHTHPEIEAAMKIRKEPGFDCCNIEEIQVRTYKGVIGKHDTHDIYGEASARMSIPFSLAVSLVTGKAGIDEFTEQYVNDGMVRQLTKKVRIYGDEELSKLVPEKRCAVVTVCMKNGVSYQAKVDYPKGEPENPLSSDELLCKFMSMTAHAGLENRRAKAIFERIMHDDEVQLKGLF